MICSRLSPAGPRVPAAAKFFTERARAANVWLTHRVRFERTHGRVPAGSVFQTLQQKVYAVQVRAAKRVSASAGRPARYPLHRINNPAPITSGAPTQIAACAVRRQEIASGTVATMPAYSRGAINEPRRGEVRRYQQVDSRLPIADEREPSHSRASALSSPTRPCLPPRGLSETRIGKGDERALRATHVTHGHRAERREQG